MRYHVRALLALAALAALDLANHDSFGFFEPLPFVVILFAFAAALAASVMPEVVRGPEDAAVDGDLLALGLTAIGLTVIGIEAVYLTYVDDVTSYAVARWSAAGGFAVCVAALFWPVLTTRLGSIARSDFMRRLPWILGGLLAGVVTIDARIEAGFAHPGWETPVAFVALYALGTLVFLQRHTLCRRETRADARGMTVLLAVALALGLLMRAMILDAAPNPVIDVFAVMRDGTDHLLAGRNLYAEDIATPYGTPRASLYGITDPAEARPAGYPPHPYLITAPFRAAGLDPRWADVVGDAVAAVALFGVALRRGRPRAGLLAAVTFLFLPRTSVMLESAWYEPMIAALLGVGLWLVEAAGAWRWLGFLALGLALTAKQYGLPLLPTVVWPHRANWRLMLLGLLTGLALIAPWLIWSPHDFMDIVVWKHLSRPPQYGRAMTIAAACYYFTDLIPRRELLWAIAAGLIAIVSWRSTRPGAAAALGVGTALFIFSLFHTQGFFNYFHLIQYLLLLGAVGLLPREESRRTVS